MKKSYLYFIIILLVVLVGYFSVSKVRECQLIKSLPEDVQESFEIAGDNKKELLKLIEAYRSTNDSLKLKAALFLIANMKFHYSWHGRQLDGYRHLFQRISKIKRLRTSSGKQIDVAKRKRMIESAWDSLVSIYGVITPDKIEQVCDLRIIKYETLYENIEYAFKAWSLPWARHLTFKEFCEYVLPYRYKDENISNWRKEFFENYKWVIDSVSNPSDPVEVASLVNKELSSWFEFNELFYQYPTALSVNELLAGQMGSCREQNGIAACVMRSIGLPIANEYIPKWARGNMGHDFSAVMAPDGRFLDFVGTESSPGHNSFVNVVPKIFRRSFSKKENPLLKENPENVPAELYNANIEDVTRNYIQTSDITIKLNHDISRHFKYLYICVFNERAWMPVFWGAVRGDSITFHDMGRDAIYLVVSYENKRINPVSQPIILKSEGTTITLTPHLEEKQIAMLRRKYPLSPKLVNLATHMIGGEFQGSNDKDFKNLTTLYKITETPVQDIVTRDLKVTTKFRYVRFLFPNLKYAQHCNISEIAFLTSLKGTEVPLRGNAMHSKGLSNSQTTLLFDRKYDNYLAVIKDRNFHEESDSLNNSVVVFSDTVWVGYDLISPRKINEVLYCPRNDTNGIYPENIYELLYWDFGWHSLGKKIPTTNYVTYKNIPENSLLWLRNLSGGREERIFQYKNGQQQWW